ncbi:MAG: family transcriptional regulator, regulator of embCAB operon [Micromonosporaceae bacterium]|nr:family transcriptional regulator, regulator of embCAB operon [Micromonosporaceae bacterium]
MEFKILGTLEVIDSGGLSRTPTAPKMRQLLATLLVRANQFVSIEALVDEVWGDDPPASAVTTIQTYIHYLRKELNPTPTPTSTVGLVTAAQGYVLRVCDEHLDAAVFTRLAEEAGRLLESNQPGEASRVARTALSLWRGFFAAGVTAGPILRARAAHLEEVKMQTLDVWIQAEILLGRHRQIMPDLRSLVISYPLNERLHAHLIGALKKAGRRAEALDAFRHYRHILDTMLGLEPSQELRELQRAVLIET